MNFIQTQRGCAIPFPFKYRSNYSLFGRASSLTTNRQSLSCPHVVSRECFHGPSNSQREHHRTQQILFCYLAAQTTRTLCRCPSHNQGQWHCLSNSRFSHFWQPSSNKRTFLPLREITQLERSDLADHSLLLVLNLKKNYNLAFTSDSELYDWQDDIYQRCPLGNYSAPFDFVHKAHIGGDAISGTFSVSRDIRCLSSRC
jgi:hypothetical protein